MRGATQVGRRVTGAGDCGQRVEANAHCGASRVIGLLMLLWGHLDIERMNLEGVEFRDPRKDGGCDPDAWGPAARKSRSRYVSEYEATKAAKPGVFGSFRDKVNGLVSRIGGGCRKEGVAIEV